MSILKKRKKNQAEVSKAGSLWSIAFFLATLGNFLLFSVTVLLLLISHQREVLHRETLIAFATGFFLFSAVLVTTEMRKIRTVIHEMKHAVVVLLTGNKLNKIVANTEDGFVEYQMYEDRLHFAPIISLAPYFFPFFSLPIFIGAVLVEHQSLVLSALILGGGLASDICLGIGEIHPSQSDFKSLFGGFWLAKFYLVGFYLFWPCFVFLWINAGTSSMLIGLEKLSLALLKMI